MTLQIWSWRNSKDIAVPNCDASEGLLWKHYLIKTRSNQKKLVSADHLKPMFWKVFTVSPPLHFSTNWLHLLFLGTVHKVTWFTQAYITVVSAKGYACEAMYIGKEQLKKEFWRLREKVKIRQVKLDISLLLPLYAPVQKSFIFQLGERTTKLGFSLILSWKLYQLCVTNLLLSCVFQSLSRFSSLFISWRWALLWILLLFTKLK